MAAIHGEDWQSALRAIPTRTGEAASPRAPAARSNALGAGPPASPAGAADAGGILQLLDTPPRGGGAASDETGAFSEGSWEPLSDGEVRERLERNLEEHESMKDFERRLLRAQAVLVLRRAPVPPGAVEFGMRKARFSLAARAHPEGVVAALEARLHAVLDVVTEEADEDVRALMELLTLARGGGARGAVAGGEPVLGATRSARALPPGQSAAVNAATSAADEGRSGGLVPAFPSLTGEPPPGTQPQAAAASANDSALATALQSLAGAIGQRSEKKSSTIQVKPNLPPDVRGLGFRRREFHRRVRGDGRAGERRCWHVGDGDGARSWYLFEGIAPEGLQGGAEAGETLGTFVGRPR